MNKTLFEASENSKTFLQLQTRHLSTAIVIGFVTDVIEYAMTPYYGEVFFQPFAQLRAPGDVGESVVTHGGSRFERTKENQGIQIVEGFRRA